MFFAAIMFVLRSVVRGFMSFYKLMDKVFLPIIEVVFPQYLPLPLIRKCRIWAPNRMTVFRVLFAFPIGYYISVGEVLMAFWIFVVGGILDFVDGRLATICKLRGYSHDEVLGAALDAICDKGFWVLVAIVILIATDPSQVPPWYMAVTIPSLLLTAGLELKMGVVRWEDYLATKRANGTANLLRSKGPGKLKFVVQLFGLGGLILGQPSLTTWPAMVAVVCNVLAAPLTWWSLHLKLQARHRIGRPRKQGRRAPPPAPAG